VLPITPALQRQVSNMHSWPTREFGFTAGRRVRLFGILFAGVLAFLWLGGGRLQPNGPPPPNRAAELEASGAGAAPQQTATGRVDAFRSAGKETPPSADPKLRSAEVPPAIEALLTKSGYEIRASQVADLDPVTEAALIARYRKTDSIRAKFSIMRILAFGGGTPSVELLTNALLQDFRVAKGSVC
jgi:hypothetical protein